MGRGFFSHKQLTDAEHAAMWNEWYARQHKRVPPTPADRLRAVKRFLFRCVGWIGVVGSAVDAFEAAGAWLGFWPMPPVPPFVALGAFVSSTIVLYAVFIRDALK